MISTKVRSLIKIQGSLNMIQILSSILIQQFTIFVHLLLEKMNYDIESFDKLELLL